MTSIRRISLGDRIKKLRYRKGLTQTELGELCGWPDSRIGVYERNEVKKPRAASLMTLASAFGMAYEEFMEGVDI